MSATIPGRPFPLECCGSGVVSPSSATTPGKPFPLECCGSELVTPHCAPGVCPIPSVPEPERYESTGGRVVSGGIPPRALFRAIPVVSKDRRQGNQGGLYTSRWPVANLLGIRLHQTTGGGDRELGALPTVSMLLPGIPTSVRLISPLLPPPEDRPRMMTMVNGLINRVAVNLRGEARPSGWSLRQISPVLLLTSLMEWMYGMLERLVMDW